MSKSIKIAVLVGGVVLLIQGIIAYNSSRSDISRFFSGSATDEAVWLLMAGLFITVLGLVGLSRRVKTR